MSNYQPGDGLPTSNSSGAGSSTSSGGTGKGSAENHKFWNEPNSVDGSVPIFGLPPSAYYTEGVDQHEQARIAASFGIMDITPCLQQFGDSADNEIGLTLFHLDPEKAKEPFNNYIKSYGFPEPKLPLRIAFLNDLSISESWTNQYGESSFEGMMNVGSTKLQELRGITGANSGSEAINDITAAASQRGGIGGALAKLFGGTASSIMGLGEGIMNGIGGKAGSALMSGSKVDFPDIWQGSGYNTSLSFTVRLYNPNPKSPEAYEAFILYPLACLLTLCNPRADSKYTYNFPILVKVNCPGLFCIDTGYISNIDMVKGGDTNDITFQQQPGMVDLKITINNLYSTMILDPLDDPDPQSKDCNKMSGRPTVKRYIDNMRGWTDYTNFYQYEIESGDPNEDDSTPSETASQDEEDTPDGEEDTSRNEDGDYPDDADTEGEDPPLDSVDGGAEDDGSLSGVSDEEGGPTPEYNNLPGEDIGGTGDFAPGDLSDAAGSLSDISNGMGDAMGSLSGGITGALGGITGGIGGALGGLTGGLNGALGGLTGGLSNVTGVMSGMMGSVDLSSFSSLTSSLGDFSGSLNGALGGITGGLNDALGGLTGGLTGGLNDALGGLTGGLTGGLNDALGGLTGGLNGALGGLDSQFSQALTGMTGGLGGVFSGIGIQIPNITDVSFGINVDSLTNITSMFGSTPSLGNISTTLSGLGLPSGQINQIYNVFSNVGNISPSPSDILSVLSDMGVSIPNTSNIGTSLIPFPTSGIS